MAENAEQEVAVEEQAGVQEEPTNGAPDADSEARYRYDEALLIRVKGKVKRPAKPDDAERDVPLNKLKAEIDKYSARIKEIKETVDASRSSRDSQSAGNKEIIKRLQALRNEFQSVLRQKQHIREELQATLKSRDDLRTASRQLRDRLPRGVNMDNLEAQLAELEYKMQHESGADDKYLFKRIQELNQARPMLREYTDTEAKLKSLDGVRADIQARLSQCDAVLNDVKAREEAERATLDEARGKQAANEPDIPALNAEKKECWDIIQALRAKMDEVRKEFSAKYVEWIRLDKNYNNYMRSVKRKEWEERQKAREAREAAQQDADAQDPSNPNAGAATAAGGADAPVVEAYAAEVFTLDQLLTYLRKLVPADVQAAAAESQKKEVEVPKGMKLLKKNEEEEFFSVARKKPAGKKGSSSAAAAPAAAAEPSSSKPAVDSGKRKLNHTLELLQTFMRFSIEVPQTVAELPATIEKAEAKKAYYLELRRTGKKHEEPKPARAAAAAAPAAASEASGSSSSSGTTQDAAPTPAEAAQKQAEQRAGGAADALSTEAPVAAAAAAAAPAEEAVAAADDSNGPPAQEEAAAAPPAPAEEEFEAAAAPPAELPPAVAEAPAAAEEKVEEEPPAAAAVQEAAAPASAAQQQKEAPSSSGLGVDLAVDEASGTVALKLNLA